MGAAWHLHLGVGVHEEEGEGNLGGCIPHHSTAQVHIVRNEPVWVFLVMEEGGGKRWSVSEESETHKGRGGHSIAPAFGCG